MKKNYILGAVLLVSCIFNTTLAAANDKLKFESAINKLCERQKQCALTSIAEEEMPPEMKQMIMMSINMVCASLLTGFEAQIMVSHELYTPAAKCINSMASLSCDTLQNENANTPECDQFEKLSEQQ